MNRELGNIGSIGACDKLVHISKRKSNDDLGKMRNFIFTLCKSWNLINLLFDITMKEVKCQLVLLKAGKLATAAS